MIILSLFLGCPVSLSAQAGLGIAGGYASADNYTLNYSVGQVFNTAIEQSDFYISQGIQHPSLVVVDGFSNWEIPGLDSMVVVFPNPVEEELHIDLKQSFPRECQVYLFNMHGELVMQRSLGSSKMRLPMVDVAPGSYLLSIRSGATVIQTCTIIKTQ
jgi:hypothetical protein